MATAMDKYIHKCATAKLESPADSGHQDTKTPGGGGAAAAAGRTKLLLCYRAVGPKRHQGHRRIRGGSRGTPEEPEGAQGTQETPAGPEGTTGGSEEIPRGPEGHSGGFGAGRCNRYSIIFQPFRL